MSKNLNFGTDKSKLFWYDQWLEIKETAQSIIRRKRSPNYQITGLLDEFELGLITDKQELEEKIMGLIMDMTTPRQSKVEQAKLF